jgi:microcystin-dependent protein
MSQPFMGEIKLVSFNYAPRGWAEANGQFLPINQNQALFSLLGTTYGGNGQTTFALPNLRGRVPISMGSEHTLGEAAGSTAVTVNIQQLPTHLHGLQATNVDANRVAPPAGATLGPANNLYGAASSLTTMNPSSVTSVGGSQAHTNMMPYLTLNFIIALQGIFPSQT